MAKPKFLLGMLIASVLFFSLQGCGTKPSSVQSTPTETAQQAPVTTQSSTKDVTTEPSSTLVSSTASTSSITSTQPKSTPQPSVSTSSTSKTTTPTTKAKTQPSIQRSPTILVASDPHGNFSYFQQSGFNITSPFPSAVDNTATVPVNKFTITWDGDWGAPNFCLRVVDETPPGIDVVFWAYIGDVHSYTVPASLLKPNTLYKVEVEATNGTNYNQQGYLTVSPKNLSTFALFVRTSG